MAQEPTVRASPAQHHRRRDSTPSAFGDMNSLHAGGGERLTSPPQPMHARRHSAAGALTGLLCEAPGGEHGFRRRMTQEDMEGARSAQTQVCVAMVLVRRAGGMGRKKNRVAGINSSLQLHRLVAHTLTGDPFSRPHPGCSGRTERHVRGGYRDSGRSRCHHLSL